MQRTVEDKGPRSDLEAITKMEEDLKSAWYEAQDIMDTVEYHRIEQRVLGHTSSWVWRRLAAAAACIDRCFRRSWLWLGRRIDITRAALLQYAQRFYQRGRSIVHGFLQHTQSFFCRWQPEKFKGATTVTTPGPLLPISGSGASMVGTSISSLTSPAALAASGLGGPKPPLLLPKETVVEKEEQEKVNEEIQEEEEEKKKEKKQEEMKEEEQEKVEEIGEEEEETVREAENGAFYHCMRSILIRLSNAIASARHYRDFSYDVVGINSNQVTIWPSC